MPETTIKHKLVFPFDYSREGCARFRVNIRSFEEFVRFVNTEIRKDGDFIYRGHLSSNWELMPSLFRDLQIDEDEKAQALLKEQLEQFKLAARGRCNLDANEEEDLWWALGQHLGLRTPLLDWTRSPYIALFFAFADVDEYKDWTEDRVVIMLDKGAIEKRKQAGVWDSDDRQHVMCFFEPFSHENPRLVCQSGLFSVTPTLWSVELMAESEFEDEPDRRVLTRLFIPDKIRAEVLYGLDQMNINYLSLFPDLDGAAKHCNLKHDIAHVIRKHPDASTKEESDV